MQKKQLFVSMTKNNISKPESQLKNCLETIISSSLLKKQLKPLIIEELAAAQVQIVMIVSDWLMPV